MPATIHRSAKLLLAMEAVFLTILFTVGRADDATSNETAAQVNALIELLDPTNNGEVIQSWIKLRDLGVEAFPQAIEHMDDKRFSFERDSGSTDWKWTVGHACSDLLWCNLEPYNHVMLSSSIPGRNVWWRPVYCRTFLDTPEKAKAWFDKRQGKSLVELQIEVLEWVVSNHSGRKVEIDGEDRDQLLKLLEELKRTKTPLEPDVPWAP